MDTDISRLKTGRLSAAALDEVLHTAESVKKIGTRNRLYAVLSLALEYVAEDGDIPLSKMTDTAAVIHEFISRHYNRNVRLAELAALLNFSEKQAERLVIKHTGTTFRKAVIKTRLTVADYLQRHTELTNAAIAEKERHLMTLLMNRSLLWNVGSTISLAKFSIIAALIQFSLMSYLILQIRKLINTNNFSEKI